MGHVDYLCDRLYCYLSECFHWFPEQHITVWRSGIFDGQCLVKQKVLKSLIKLLARSSG